MHTSRHGFDIGAKDTIYRKAVDKGVLVVVGGGGGGGGGAQVCNRPILIILSPITCVVIRYFQSRTPTLAPVSQGIRSPLLFGPEDRVPYRELGPPPGPKSLVGCTKLIIPDPVP